MIVAAILLALIIIVLAIPFEVIFNIQRQEEFHSVVTVHWLFGAVKFTIPDKRTQPPRITKQKVNKPKTAGKKPAKARAVRKLLWNTKFRYRLIRFVKDVFKSIHIAGFYLRIRLGLDNPADTGRLWAFFGPLAVFLSSLSNTTVQLEPDFQTEVVSLDSRGRVRVVPLQVVFAVLSFVFSPITIDALWKTFKPGKQ